MILRRRRIHGEFKASGLSLPTSPPRLSFLLIAFLVLALIIPAPAFGLTIGEEREMGREVFTAIQKSQKIVQDPVINEYVRGLGRKILRPLGPQPFDYQFFVLDKGVINAFAVPGGYLFFNTETIAAMDSEGELAAIIAHEVAHVTSRHIAKRIENNRKLSLAALGGMLAGILIGGPAGPALMAGSMGGSLQAMLSYSREDETQADHKGLDYLVDAGYNPQDMINAFDKMLSSTMAISNDIPTYLSTHPGLNSRIQRVRTQVAAHPGLKRKHDSVDNKAFQAIKARVIALYTDETRAAQYFRRILTQNPKNAQGYYGRALLYYRSQNVPAALDELQKAIKLDPANANYLTDMGDMMFHRHEFERAASALGRAIVLRPQDTRPLYILGRLYEEENNLEKAQDLYERVLAIDPDHAETLNHIGIVYGRQGDLARAHLHTGLYFESQGEYKKALFHLRHAKSVAGNSPYDVRDRIERELKMIQGSKELEKEKEEEKPQMENEPRRKPPW